MGKIISVANQKGGVGKTTTTINLGAALALMEKRVLLVDSDPQANTTSGLGLIEDHLEHDLYHCLIDEYKAHDVIQKSMIEYMDILPSSIDLVGAEIDLVNKNEREYQMKRVLSEVKNDYDYILIDCLPSLGLLTINALVGSDAIIIPVQCEIFSLEGLGKLKKTISLVKQSYNPALEIEGIVLSMYDQRLRMAKMVVEEVRNLISDRIFDTIIHRNSKIAEAPSMKQPVLMYDANSKGAQNFLNLGLELLKINNDPVPNVQ